MAKVLTETQTFLNEVFVAGPFWQAIDEKTGRVGSSVMTELNSVMQFFEELGCVVHNAHRRESWGEKFLECHEYTPLDLEEIRKSDLLVAFPGVPASPGTHVELGWASALGKPIILLLERGAAYAGLVEGLKYVALVEEVFFTSVDEILDGLPIAIDAVQGRLNGGAAVSS
jgi:nucleoside 2-deoxyribosyltransferase